MRGSRTFVSPFAALPLLALFLWLGVAQQARICATHFDINSVEAGQAKAVKTPPARISANASIGRAKPSSPHTSIVAIAAGALVPIEAQALPSISASAASQCLAW